MKDLHGFHFALPVYLNFSRNRGLQCLYGEYSISIMNASVDFLSLSTSKSKLEFISRTQLKTACLLFSSVLQ